MKSPICWALLGLVIERPGYAYELGQRFERRYEHALSLSSVSHVYKALAALHHRGLIEQVEGAGGGRQPRPLYQATAYGFARYREQLVEEARLDQRRQRLFVLRLAALRDSPQAIFDVLDGYEQAWLDEAQVSVACDDGHHDSDASWVRALMVEDSRLLAGAKLSWVRYARQRLSGVVRPPSGPSR